MADRPRTGGNPDDEARTARADRASTPEPARIHPAAKPERPDQSAPDPSPSPSPAPDPERDRRIRRARFLAELAEARELRKRVAPRRTRAAELHARVLRTFRY